MSISLPVPGRGRVLLPLLLVMALLGAWELYVDLGGASPLVLPAPHAIAQAFYTDRSTLWSNFLVTLKEVVFGLGIGLGCGFVLALAVHLSSVLRRAVLPLLIASQALPIPLVAPLFLLWLGFGILPKLLVIALVAFFPVVITTLAALETVEPALIKLMATFDAKRLQTLRRVELPAALPGLFTGAKLAAVFSVIGVVFAEQAGSNSGLGYLFTIAYNQFIVGEAYATVVILCALAIALFASLTLLERRALPWAYQPKGDTPR